MHNEHQKPSNNDRTTDRPSPPPRLSIDYTLYQTYLEQSDLTDEQKRAFLDSLWSIIVSFVDLGFGIHPLQQVDETCEQNDISLENLLFDTDDMIGWEDHTSTKPNTSDGLSADHSRDTIQKGIDHEQK